MTALASHGWDQAATSRSTKKLGRWDDDAPRMVFFVTVIGQEERKAASKTGTKDQEYTFFVMVVWDLFFANSAECKKDHEQMTWGLCLNGPAIKA